MFALPMIVERPGRQKTTVIGCAGISRRRATGTPAWYGERTLSINRDKMPVFWTRAARADKLAVRLSLVGA
jgi:hypothetical protein